MIHSLNSGVCMEMLLSGIQCLLSMFDVEEAILRKDMRDVCLIWHAVGISRRILEEDHQLQIVALVLLAFEPFSDVCVHLADQSRCHQWKKPDLTDVNQRTFVQNEDCYGYLSVMESLEASKLSNDELSTPNMRVTT